MFSATQIPATRPLARRATPQGLFARLADALALRRQRHQLAALDDALLADIGLTRAEAVDEASRPVWDAPLHWRR